MRDDRLDLDRRADDLEALRRMARAAVIVVEEVASSHARRGGRVIGTVIHVVVEEVA